jgi:hypothetical protein
MTAKEQFLIEHNKLSPVGLQADMDLLTRFRVDKASLFRNNSWSMDKIRRPFILWLTSSIENREIVKNRKL